jgi:Family of unknown function (DUF6086)
MSYIFECDGETIWSPSFRTGAIFSVFADALANEFSLDAGLVWNGSDMAALDLNLFLPFLECTLTTYRTSTSSLRLMLGGFVATLLVLAERSGHGGQEVDAELAAMMHSASGKMAT